MRSISLSKPAHTVVLVLHNIRSVHNVGSIFRTADAAGVSRIILSGYTPAPLDRFNRPRRDFAKVSLGAEKTIPWVQVPHLSLALQQLKQEGYTVLAIEQSPNAKSLFEWRSPAAGAFAIVLGNEVEGLAPHELIDTDHILEIPMHGNKESLNVSVAAGVALFTLLHT